MSPESTAPDDGSRRRVARGENRIPPALAVVAAIAVYAALLDSLLFTSRFVIPTIEGLLLVALVVTNPRRITRQTRWSRGVSIALAACVIVSNLVSLGLLVATISSSGASGTRLLVAGLQVWFTDVIGFALLFWELDRGGPVARREVARDRMQPADWRFSQDENHDNVSEVRRTSSATAGWVPIFVDYLYLSLTNSSAFSPTDTMPLSGRAKLLMGVQATAALLTSLLVIAKAVGSLGSGG